MKAVFFSVVKLNIAREPEGGGFSLATPLKERVFTYAIHAVKIGASRCIGGGGLRSHAEFVEKKN